MSAAPEFTSDQRAAVERARRIALNVEVYRARIRGEAASIIDLVGFGAFIAAWHRDLITITEEARRLGLDLGDWTA